MTHSDPIAPRARPPRRPGRARLRGFTLVEAAVTTALVAVLAALAINAYSGLKRTSSFSAVAGDMLSGYADTHLEALGRGTRTVFVVDTVGGRWWGVEDVGSDFSLDAFNPAIPVVAPDRLIVSGTLGANVKFGPTAGWGSSFDVPFAKFPSTTAAGANYAYCSFCKTTGTNTGFGAITFVTGDPARFSGGPTSTPGQVFSVTDTAGISVTAVAVVARTGIAQVFSR
jgi:hypothetical protein